MINLLPAEVKKQIGFSRKNTRLRHYVIIALLTSVLLSATLMVGNLYTKRFSANVEQQLAIKQKEVANYTATEKKARTINSQLKKLLTVSERTTRYSAVLNDLAKSLPANTKISGFKFDGNPNNKLELIVTAADETTALSVQPTLEATDRFSFVDIQEFSKAEGHFQVSVALAFASAEAARR